MTLELTLLERDKIPLGTGSPNRHGQSMRGGIRKVLRLIEQAPTIDAVQVVRCKDCRYRFTRHCSMFHEEQTYNEDDGYDWIEHDYTSDDGFCDEGERRDGEDDD